MLRTNAPTLVGDTRIVASNIWEEEYTPEAGQPTRGMTAHLWIMEPEPAGKRGSRVHPGKVLGVTGGRIRVVAITEKAVQIEVELASSETPERPE
jgi:hypothetical protein